MESINLIRRPGGAFFLYNQHTNTNNKSMWKTCHWLGSHTVVVLWSFRYVFHFPFATEEIPLENGRKIANKRRREVKKGLAVQI